VRERRSRRGAAAWALVACWAVWLALRLTGADRVPAGAGTLVPLITFLPYVAATSMVPAVCALLLRRRAAAAAAAVVMVAFAGVLAPRVLPDGAGRARGPVLRVLTANLLDGLADPRALVDLVRRTRADVIALPELNHATVRALDAAGLGRLLPYRVTDIRPEARGNGLYARYALRPLGDVAGRGAAGLAMPRALLRIPGHPAVEVVAVHSNPPLTPVRTRQWDRDLRALPPPAASTPRVLAGDFNATLDHARMRDLLAAGYRDAAAAAGKGLVPTFGGSLSRPPITIDHIVVDARVGVRAVSVHPVPGSDHKAVAAELRLP
jgi:endonuclease/exonuclease/phosphatase (EEP) superfamily protein YafD